MNVDRRLNTGSIQLLLIVALFIVLLRTGWVSDDAYITLRTISNFARGQGLTWNVGERVQSYTHPLWLLTLGLGIFFTREFYFTTIFVSIILSTAAFALIAFRLSKGGLTLAAVGAILIFSKAFIDYSTSGLENPLSNLLLVLYSLVLLRYQGSRRDLLILGGISCLAFLARPDNILIFYPALIAAFLQFRSRQHLGALLMSQLPALAWEGFSLLYYGLAVPNTALAKLNTGIPSSELIHQGWLYLLDSLERDPITLAAILLGLASVMLLRSWKRTAVAAGIILQLMYTIRIGGDFMSGRFLSLSLLAAVVLLSQLNLSRTSAGVLLGAVFLLGLAAPYPTILTGQDYGQSEGQRSELFNGVTDERGFYYPDTGLLRADRILDLPRHPWVYEGTAARAQEGEVVSRDTIGFFGFYAGPEVHIVDYYGLADPLLSHLPARSSLGWRTGHFERDIPGGYLESIRAGTNLIEDPSLAKFYDAVELVTRGSLFAPGRMRAIWKLNTGGYDELLEDYSRSKYPTVNATSLVLGGELSESSAPVLFKETGISILFDVPKFGEVLRLGISNRVEYSLFYMLDEQTLGRQVLSVWDEAQDEIAAASIVIPAAVQQTGFDRILIIPDGFGQYMLQALEVE